MRKIDLSCFLIDDEFSVTYLDKTTLFDIEPLCEQFPDMETINRRRFSDIDTVGILVRLGKKIVGYAWLKFDSEYVTNCGMKISSESKYAWGYYIHVHEDYRSTVVFPLLTNKMKECIEERGYEGKLSETNIENEASLKSFRRIGCNVYQKIYVVSLLGLNIFIIRSIPEESWKIDWRWSLNTHEVRYSIS